MGFFELIVVDWRLKFAALRKAQMLFKNMALVRVVVNFHTHILHCDNRIAYVLYTT